MQQRQRYPDFYFSAKLQNKQSIRSYISHNATDFSLIIKYSFFLVLMCTDASASLCIALWENILHQQESKMNHVLTGQ